jgi:hypothetical protein
MPPYTIRSRECKAWVKRSEDDRIEHGLPLADQCGFQIHLQRVMPERRSGKIERQIPATEEFWRRRVIHFCTIPPRTRVPCVLVQLRRLHRPPVLPPSYQGPVSDCQQESGPLTNPRSGAQDASHRRDSQLGAGVGGFRRDGSRRWTTRREPSLSITTHWQRFEEDAEKFLEIKRTITRILDEKKVRLNRQRPAKSVRLPSAPSNVA